VLNIIPYGIKRFDEEYNRRRDAWVEAGKEVPSQDEIDEAALCYKGGCCHLPEGVAATELFPGCGVIHWVEDPLIEVLVAATLAELPEFLVATDPAVRRLVQEKVDYLIGVREEVHCNG